MSRKTTPTAGQSREDRLKAALKANLGRRKAQARQKAQAHAAPKTGEDAADKKE
ncbi:hypothetical protein [Pseudooctadecabacter sp.]|uniref:hypothetical protein n=1 Tax=Pseudooctadecabacter sp. TaxID=1966338 RepID=UPI0025FA3824|nr:hypothetical protein [Pseudooctadecabacter sp.]